MGNGTGATEAIDRTIGLNIKTRRIILGLSRQQLSKKVGITHQQIAKNEDGANRVAASRLPDFARALKMEISDFFDQDTGDIELPDSKNRAVIELNRHLFALDEKVIYSVVQFVRHLRTALGK